MDFEFNLLAYINMGSNPSSRKQTSMNSKKLYMLIQEIKKGKPEVVKLIKGFPNWKELGIADVK